MSLNFCFIGAGNLATQLAKALQLEGNFITQVYSRTEKSAKELGEILSVEYVTSVDSINRSADVYFVALKDSAVEEVLSQMDFEDKLVVHCSGSLPLSILDNHSKNTGVFYPLQTFSKTRNVDFRTVPIFIEANTPENETILTNLAAQVSGSVQLLNSESRKALHLSAVFACNFVNHLYNISSEILKSKDIPFEVLRPLILETAQKVQDMTPEAAQTGPAIRFDQNIISAHLKELEQNSDYHQLYSLLSKGIFEHHKRLE